MFITMFGWFLGTRFENCQEQSSYQGYNTKVKVHYLTKPINGHVTLSRLPYLAQLSLA